MTNIELVIRIPKEIQLALINNIELSIDQQSFMDSCIKQAIINGIVLSKGHGKLIDADEEIQRFCDKVCGHTLKECGYGFYCPLVQRMISAPPIIEADNIERKGI